MWFRVDWYIGTNDLGEIVASIFRVAQFSYLFFHACFEFCTFINHSFIRNETEKYSWVYEWLILFKKLEVFPFLKHDTCFYMLLVSHLTSLLYKWRVLGKQRSPVIHFDKPDFASINYVFL